jgi:hypothetical protein
MPPDLSRERESGPVSADGKTKVRIETAFLAIPDAIAREPDLSSSAKVLFGCIFSLSYTESGCYGSNYSLAKRVGLSRRQLQRVFLELEKWKLIRRRIEGEASERPEIEVLWKGKILKPRKAPDKLSKGRKTPDKLSTPHDNLSGGTPHDKLSVAPPMTSCHTLQDKKRKPSGPDGPEKVFHKIAGPTTTDPDGSPSVPTQDEDPEATAEAWRAFRAQYAVASKQAIADALSPENAPVRDDPVIRAELARRRRREP